VLVLRKISWLILVVAVIGGRSCCCARQVHHGGIAYRTVPREFGGNVSYRLTGLRADGSVMKFRPTLCHVFHDPPR